MHRREFFIGLAALSLSPLAVGCSPDTNYTLKQTDIVLPPVQPLSLRDEKFSPWALNSAEFFPVRDIDGVRLARMNLLTGVRSDRNVDLLPWRASLRLPSSIDQDGSVSSQLHIRRLSVGTLAQAFPSVKTEIPEDRENILIGLDVKLPGGDAYGWIVREGAKLIVAQLQGEGSSDVHTRRVLAFSFPPLPALG